MPATGHDTAGVAPSIEDQTLADSPPQTAASPPASPSKQSGESIALSTGRRSTGVRHRKLRRKTSGYLLGRPSRDAHARSRPSSSLRAKSRSSHAVAPDTVSRRSNVSDDGQRRPHSSEADSCNAKASLKNHATSHRAASRKRSTDSLASHPSSVCSAASRNTTRDSSSCWPLGAAGSRLIRRPTSLIIALFGCCTPRSFSQKQPDKPRPSLLSVPDVAQSNGTATTAATTNVGAEDDVVPLSAAEPSHRASLLQTPLAVNSLYEHDGDQTPTSAERKDPDTAAVASINPEMPTLQTSDSHSPSSAQSKSLDASSVDNGLPIATAREARDMLDTQRSQKAIGTPTTTTTTTDVMAVVTEENAAPQAKGEITDQQSRSPHTTTDAADSAAVEAPSKSTIVSVPYYANFPSKRSGLPSRQAASDDSGSGSVGQERLTHSSRNSSMQWDIDDESSSAMPVRLPVHRPHHPLLPSPIDEDDMDIEDDDDSELRSEITSPPGNVVSESSERLVTHISRQHLLGMVSKEHIGRKCLVLDLDETLVHSSFRPVDHPDYIVPVLLDGQEHDVYVAKRPGVDEFLIEVGKYYEVVVFTASLSMYADPVLDLLDTTRVVKHRLFRDSCNLHNGNYVKDLSRLGRDVSQTIIIDNSPASYAFHPDNAIAITSWFNDPHDTELLDLIPLLIDIADVDDVAAVLSLSRDDDTGSDADDSTSDEMGVGGLVSHNKDRRVAAAS